MNWLIVEDALKGSQGHWHEFVKTFKQGLNEIGDHVEILGPRDCEATLIETLSVQPILPKSLWLRGNTVSRIASALATLNWLTASFVVISHYLASTPANTLIFVPTVGIPHLFLWRLLIFAHCIPPGGRVLLYFMSTPVKLSATRTPEVYGLWGRLFFIILSTLSAASRSGRRLVLATETEALSNALSQLSGAHFVTLPQPVRQMTEPFSHVTNPILVGSYGPARFEKGSDLMIAAIDKFLSKTDRNDINFAVQWIDDFTSSDGHLVTIPNRLLLDPRFVLIDHLFAPGEYAQWLQRTSLMLLPYRDDYALRGSRVVLEAIVHGIPVLVSRGTTLEEHLNGFGVGMSCDCRNPDTLYDALICSVSKLKIRSNLALEKANDARVHFSVANFRGLLCG